jgi:hypothetical protein
VEAAFSGRLGPPIWFNTFWKALSKWSCGSYSVILVAISIHLMQSTLSQAEDRQCNLFACASQWFTFGKIPSTLCSAFTESRSKAGEGRTFLRTSPDTRTRSTIWIWTHNKRGRKLILFEYFHQSCWAANPDDITEILKQKFNPESASFRLFGVAQGSKVGCTFRKAWNIGCPTQV